MSCDLTRAVLHAAMCAATRPVALLAAVGRSLAEGGSSPVSDADDALLRIGRAAIELDAALSAANELGRVLNEQQRAAAQAGRS